LQRGRFLSETDVNGSRRVAVVSAEFVKRYLNGTDPIGQMVNFKVFDPRPPQGNSQPAANATPPPPNLPFEIIGVGRRHQEPRPAEPPEPEAYVPYGSPAISTAPSSSRAPAIRSRRSTQCAAKSGRRTRPSR
jgi:hypothetical protein